MGDHYQSFVVNFKFLLPLETFIHCSLFTVDLSLLDIYICGYFKTSFIYNFPIYIKIDIKKLHKTMKLYIALAKKSFCETLLANTV